MKDFDKLLKLTEGKYSTCSLSNPKEQSVTFLKSPKYIDQLSYLKNFKDMLLVAPWGVDIPKTHVHVVKTRDVDLLFTLYHNYVHKDFNPLQSDSIHKTASIHPTAVVGVDGIKVVLDGDKKILFKHTGNVVIKANTDIGANAVIHRSRLDSTVIGEGSIIGALTNIGHNVVVGKNCVFTTNISVGGSAVFGDNCWVGMGALIKNNINICSDVVLGMGSAVLKDIKIPGVYAGNPVKFIGGFGPDQRGF